MNIYFNVFSNKRYVSHTVHFLFFVIISWQNSSTLENYIKVFNLSNYKYPIFIYKVVHLGQVVDLFTRLIPHWFEILTVMFSRIKKN